MKSFEIRFGLHGNSQVYRTGEIKVKRIGVFIMVSVFLTAFAQNSREPDAQKTESGLIEVDGGKLYYELAGEGEWIVLLHDGILHHVVWDDQFPVLAEKYRVVRYDRRGFGKSSAPEASFSHFEDLDRVFAELKIDRAIVFGMSAGGAMAIEFALQQPEKVRALVLVGAVVSGFPYSNHLMTRGGRLTSLADVQDPAKFIQYFGWDDPYEIYPGNKDAKQKFFRLLKENPQNVKGALGYHSQWPDRSAVRFLNEIQVPALILVGEYDIPDVHTQSGAIESGLPDAKREIIRNAGHLIPFEQPEAFNASVLKFLDELESPEKNRK